MSKKYDPQMALAAADAFRKLSQIFTSKLGNDINTAKEIAVRDIGGMIASPTVLSLSIELYLKGLISLTKPKVRETHDLCALYKLLPQNIKESVEAYYNHIKNSKANATHVTELDVALFPETVTEEDFDEWEKNNPHKTKEHSIKGVLIRSKDMFATWRYLYEVKSNQIELYNYEYARLDYIADSLRYHLVNLIRIKGDATLQT